MHQVGGAVAAASLALVLSVATLNAPLAQQTDPEQPAADPQHLKAAEDFIAATSDEYKSQVIHQITQIAWPELEASLRQQGLDRQTIDAIHDEYADAFSNVILDLMSEISAQIMMQHFTTHELRDLTALMSTPLARRYQAEEPNIMSDAAKIALQRKDEIERKLNERLQQILTKNGYCASHPKKCS